MSDTTAPTYSDWLREQMAARGWSQRELARQLNPEDPEAARRYIHRYLNGTVPILRTRHKISTVLGTADLGPDTDSEDD